ncbi:MAG: hypothetical protein COW26_06860, partial [Nitrosopumilales archaeon CG15_BIG_FIL_POST_REV_8_21_14_020_33_23]
AGTFLGFVVSETSGVALPISNTTMGSVNGTSSPDTITAQCDASVSTTGASTNAKNGTDAMNVVREAKSLNLMTGVSGGKIGQIGFNATQSTDAMWPFIQLYQLNPTGNVDIQYNKGGGAQTTKLTFDTVDQFVNVSLDRAIYPQSAQVHATITDLWLNIDPTDEDSWTFGTSSNATSKGTYYQVFDENGDLGGANVAAGVINIDSTLDTL